MQVTSDEIDVALKEQAAHAWMHSEDGRAWRCECGWTCESRFNAHELQERHRMTKILEAVKDVACGPECSGRDEPHELMPSLGPWCGCCGTIVEPCDPIDGSPAWECETCQQVWLEQEEG